MQLKVININEKGVPNSDLPMLFENLKDFYPDTDYDNLPAGYAKFIEDPMPHLSVYEVFDKSVIIKDGEFFRKIHLKREMTEDEKTAKIEEMKAKPKPFDSWIWSDERCNWMSPVPAPEEELRQRRINDPLIKCRWNEDIMNYEFYY